jgi:hypothetical protein
MPSVRPKSKPPSASWAEIAEGSNIASTASTTSMRFLSISASYVPKYIAKVAEFQGSNAS